MLPKHGFTELNILKSCNSLKSPIPKYGFTSNLFTSPLLKVIKSVKSCSGFTFFTLGFINILNYYSIKHRNYSHTLIYYWFITNNKGNDFGESILKVISGVHNARSRSVIFSNGLGDSIIMMAINIKKLRDHVSSGFSKTAYQNPEKKKYLEKLANSLNEFDNPVIRFVTFKK